MSNAPKVKRPKGFFAIIAAQVFTYFLSLYFAHRPNFKWTCCSGHHWNVESPAGLHHVSTSGMHRWPRGVYVQKLQVPNISGMSGLVRPFKQPW